MSKKDYASILYLVLTKSQNICWSIEAERELKANKTLISLLQKRKYIFKQDSPLAGQPTKKGLKALFYCGYNIPKYKVQFFAMQNHNIIPIILYYRFLKIILHLMDIFLFL